MKLIEKLQKMQSEIVITKDTVVDVGNGRSYKAYGEKEVKEVVKRVELENKVMILPTMEIVGEPTIIEKVNEYQGKKSYAYQTSVWVKCVLKIFDLESDETLETVAFGQGLDTGDKAVGKANTYALKYALMNLFKMSTGDDEGEPEKKPKGKKETAEEAKIKKEIAEITKKKRQVVTIFNNKVQEFEDDKNELYKNMKITQKEFNEEFASNNLSRLENLIGLLEMV